MEQDEKNPGEENSKTGETSRFVGEEEVKIWASPQENLAAATVLALLSVVAIILAIDFPRPDNFLTAAGLLPILTGGSLLLMAVALAVGALKDERYKGLASIHTGISFDFLQDEGSRRVLMLAVIIFIYVVMLDLITFDLRFPTPFYTFRIGTYECVSIPAVALILRLFWRASVLRCSIVSALTVFTLAAIFRDGFKILLPGAN